MPIRYFFLERADICFASWRDEVSVSDIYDNYQRYLDDPYYRPGRPEIVDVSECDFAGWSFNKEMFFAERVTGENRDRGVVTPTVIFAPTDQAFGFARMYQELTSSMGGLDVTTCRTESAAMERLGLRFASFDEMIQKDRVILAASK